MFNFFQMRQSFEMVYTNFVTYNLHLILSIFDNSLAVVVEDSSSSCCVTVKVFTHMTTAALKQQVSPQNTSLSYLCYVTIKSNQF